MKSHSILTLITLTFTGAIAFLCLPADSQTAGGFLALQGTTPGTAQPGHSNLTGTMRASQFVGGGAGLTDVIASGLNLPIAASANLPSTDGLSISVSGATGSNSAIRATLSTTNGFASAIFAQATGEGYGVRAEGVRAGVLGSTTSNIGFGVYGSNTSSGSDAIGVFGNAGGPTGVGVQGSSEGTGVVGYGGTIGVHGTGSGPHIGVQGESTFGSGVLGIMKGQSNQAAGVRGRATAASSTSFGVHGESQSIAGTGVQGYASATSGATYGVKGESNSTAGIGVFGYNPRTTGSTFGGVFESASVDGVGVYGHASRTTGATYAVLGAARSSTGVGVFGQAPSSGTGVGAWGYCESPSGWGVYANGRIGASGTKAFRIDHPVDPENKWLLHYCSEGPEPLNIYSGDSTTDAKGFATIQLPSYFEEINRNPRVQLTIDDDTEDFVMAKVVGGVKDGVCVIRTSKPNVKVYWEVKAVRNDRWMQRHGAPIELDKIEQERGKYQHPELYDLPAEKGIYQRPDLRSSAAKKSR